MRIAVGVAKLPKMSEPEISRRVRQQRADIESLYDLVGGVDRKVDALGVKLTGRIDALDAKFTGRMDKLDGRMDKLDAQIAEVLRHLKG